MSTEDLEIHEAIVDDDAFAQAERQARAFYKVLDGSEPRRALIARAAAEVNLTSRQVYNLLKRYAGEARLVRLSLSLPDFTSANIIWCLGLGAKRAKFSATDFMTARFAAPTANPNNRRCVSPTVVGGVAGGAPRCA